MVWSQSRIAGGGGNCFLKFGSPTLASNRLPALSNVGRGIHGGLAAQETSGRGFGFAHGAWRGIVAPWVLWERRTHPLRYRVYGSLLSRALTVRRVCRARSQPEG